MQFGVVRRELLPHMEKLGTVSALQLPPDAGLLELAHAVFFPDNIVGVEFNFYAPRLTRFAYYSKVKGSNLHVPVEFELLTRLDVKEKLERMIDV